MTRKTFELSMAGDTNPNYRPTSALVMVNEFGPEMGISMEIHRESIDANLGIVKVHDTTHSWDTYNKYIKPELEKAKLLEEETV